MLKEKAEVIKMCVKIESEYELNDDDKAYFYQN